MDLEAVKINQAGSVQWTKISAMACFVVAGLVLAGSLLPGVGSKTPDSAVVPAPALER
jgi:hypothetical protein